MIQQLKHLIPISLRRWLVVNIYNSEFLKKQRYFSLLKQLEALYLTDKSQLIDLINYEKSIFSQGGEDGIIFAIAKKLEGQISKIIVEFGVEDASECNSRFLVESLQWNYILMDGGSYTKPFMKINKAFITAENINELFAQLNVPNEIGILSIDIDYNTYWVLKAIDNRYSASVIVLEYNSSLPAHSSIGVPYDATRMWDGTKYFGASLKAFDNLLKVKGYTLIYCDVKGVNAFFVKNEYAKHFKIGTFEQIFRAPQYGLKQNNVYQGHKQTTEEFIEI
jgi:hypothetical protein